jgi:hypothetical protein
VKGELAIFADAPKQFDWRRLSAFNGSGVSWVMAAIIGGSRNFLFQFFSLLRQDNELFGNNYFKAYCRLAARCGQSEIVAYLMSKCPEISITKNMVLDAAASGNEELFIRLKQRFFENNPDADEFEKEIMMCLVLSGDMQLLERQSQYVALLQAMDINDLYLTIAYASVANLIMLRLILTAILENNIRLVNP